MAALANDDDASTRTKESDFEEESDLEEGQDYTPPPPLPPWPRGAAVKPPRPPRHKGLDKVKMGHDLASH